MHPSDSTVDTPQQFRPRQPSRLIAFTVAIGLAFAGYAMTMMVTRQSMLSVAVAGMLTLVGFISCRTIQRRGQLSLAICVFVLPLLLGLAFAGYRSLQPYRENQRTIDSLREQAIAFRATRVSEHGEWKQDKAGTLLPNWLADAIGPDCMREVTEITGSLDEVQSLPLDSLRIRELDLVTLRRTGESVHVSDALVGWLTDADPKDTYVKVEQLDPEDMEALNGLTCPLHLTITGVDDQTADWSSLTSLKSITLKGRSLTKAQVLQLAVLSSDAWISLDGIVWTPQNSRVFVSGLGGRPASLEMKKTQIDRDMLITLLESPRLSLQLASGVFSVTPKSVAISINFYRGPNRFQQSGDAAATTRHLSLWSRQQITSEAFELARLFRCDSLRLSYSLSEDEVKQFWQCPDLLVIRTRNAGHSMTYLRPDEPRQAHRDFSARDERVDAMGQ